MVWNGIGHCGGVSDDIAEEMMLRYFVAQYFYHNIKTFNAPLQTSSPLSPFDANSKTPPQSLVDYASRFEH